MVGSLLSVAPLTLLAAALAWRLVSMEAPAYASLAAAAPVALGLVAAVGVALSAEALVLRWLFYLERIADAYARGRYALQPDRLRRAPAEFRTLGLAVAEMAAAVRARDQGLREALEAQTMLLREVHHRVKNTLQIIGSLLSLQSARAPDTVAEALGEALVRVDALSLSQNLIVSGEAADVSARELLGALRERLRSRLRRGRALQLELEVQPVQLPAAFASTLVLIAAEAVLTAYARPVAAPMRARLGLREDGQVLRLTLAVEDDPDAFSDDAGGIALDMLGRYVRQLRGALARRAGPATLEIAAPRPMEPTAPPGR